LDDVDQHELATLSWVHCSTSAASTATAATVAELEFEIRTLQQLAELARVEIE
jgi:hypothetical protein